MSGVPTAMGGGRVRYVTGVLSPASDLHPTIPALLETPDVTPVAIHQTRLLDDGTEVTLLEARGDLERLDGVLAGHPPILNYDVVGASEGVVYSHSEPHETARRLLEVRERGGIVLQMPLRFTPDGGLRVTLLGDDREFQRAVDSVPSGLDFDVEEVGDYDPDLGRFVSTLTDRQREVLEEAVRAGYYDNPRRASQQEVADALGVTASTVSQTLRRVESNVLTRLVDGGTGTIDGAR